MYQQKDDDDDETRSYSEAYDDDDEEDENWKRQLAEIEKAEKAENSIHLIPKDYRKDFGVFLPKMPVLRRVELMQILQDSKFDSYHCKNTLMLMTKAPPERYGDLIELLQRCFEINAFPSCLFLLSRCDVRTIMEILDYIPRPEFMGLMNNMVRFISDDELFTMANIARVMSLRGLMQAMSECTMPLPNTEAIAKMCKLCRKKRIYDLHDRMVDSDNGIPPGTLKIPALTTEFSKADRWTVDDGGGFNFDIERGLVFWHKEVLDMAKLCGKCVTEVNHAACCSTRFEEFYHKPPEERKSFVAQLRQREYKTAELLAKLFREEIRRRAYRYSIDAVKAARKGQRLEDEKHAKEAEARRLEELEIRKQHDYELMISSAMSVDRKWKRHTHKEDALRYGKHDDEVNMRFAIPYGPGNNVPTKREDELSWELEKRQKDPYSKTTYPTAPDTAAKNFGSYSEEEVLEETRARRDGNRKEINKWKDEAIGHYNAHLDRKHNEYLKFREEKDGETKMLNEKVERINIEKEKRDRQIEMERERLEELRLAQRAADREARRAARIAGYEAEERRLMSIEDYLSSLYREDEKELNNAEGELEGMREAERQQRAKGDRFWGLDKWAEEELKKAERQRLMYQLRVEEMREKCIMVKITRPFVEEAKAKVFRDKFTGKVIT